VLVHGHHARTDAEVREERARDACVLGRDPVGAGERVDGTMRDVAEVPYGRRHHI
jgi:hypothetical protein